MSAVSALAGRPLDDDPLGAALNELLALPGTVLGAAARQDLHAACERLAEGRFNLVVLGEFKRGKSSLINALVGRLVLPTGVVPLTSAVTVLRHGPGERLVVRFADGRHMLGSAEDLARYATEQGNPANALGVERTTVELSCDLLAGGLQLVDTPGIGSIHLHNTETAEEVVPRIDTAMCVLGADQPVTAAERAFIADLVERVPRVIVAVNRVDALAEGDRVEALRFVHDALNATPGAGGLELFAVSARTGEGVAALRDRLRRLHRDEGDALLRAAVRLLAAHAAADAAGAAAFELRALELPLDDLDRRARAFEEGCAALGGARADARDLLEREAARMLDELVDQPLLRYATTHAPEVQAKLAAHAARVMGSPGVLAAQLETWVDARVRARFGELAPRLEAAVARRLEELECRHLERVARLLEEIEQVAADAFGVRPAAQLPRTGLVEPARFTFKLHDVEHMVDQLAALGRTMVPGALGRRMVARDADRRLVATLDRHAGRLRAELSDRVRQAVRAFDRELGDATDRAVAEIAQAVARARAERRHSERQARARRAELERVRDRCTALRDELLGAGAPR